MTKPVTKLPCLNSIELSKVTGKPGEHELHVQTRLYHYNDSFIVLHDLRSPISQNNVGAKRKSSKINMSMIKKEDIDFNVIEIIKKKILILMLIL